MATSTFDIDLAAVEQLIADGYVSRQKHPAADLYIYNYTPKCQFDRYWTAETLACRGLVTDDAGNLVARPFKKFMNFEEHYGPLPDGPYEVWKKYDGSLGIAFWYGGEWHVATRGSFTSEQAAMAQVIWTEQYGSSKAALDPEYTYLFEIIYPENRIVVNYGGTRELRLLGAIHTAGGWEQPPDPALGFPVAECLGVFEHKENPLDLKLLADDSSEGFVLRYLGSGLRLKIKFDEYVRLHRLITGVNERHIWEYLRDGVALEPLFERVPDEFNEWLRATIGGLEERYRAVETLCRSQFRDLGDRKATALYFTKECEHPAVLFRMLDNKPYSDVIWKMLRPEASRSFRQDEE